MPLDGSMGVPRPNGWIIKIGPAPALLADSRHWSPRKRHAFRELSAEAAFRTIDAIQADRLFKQRGEIKLGGNWIIYFLRRDRRDPRTILVTISHFHFRGPDGPVPPDGGHRMSIPLDLVLEVSGSGKRYTIALIRGVLPKRPNEEQILSSLDKINSKLGRLRLRVLFPWSESEHILPNIDRRGGSICYSPQCWVPKYPDYAGRGIPPLDLVVPEHVVQDTHWSSRFFGMLSGLVKTRRSDPLSWESPDIAKTGDFVSYAENGKLFIIAKRNAYASRMTNSAHLHIRNNPIRPNGFE